MTQFRDPPRNWRRAGSLLAGWVAILLLGSAATAWVESQPEPRLRDQPATSPGVVLYKLTNDGFRESTSDDHLELIWCDDATGLGPSDLQSLRAEWSERFAGSSKSKGTIETGRDQPDPTRNGDTWTYTDLPLIYRWVPSGATSSTRWATQRFTATAEVSKIADQEYCLSHFDINDPADEIASNPTSLVGRFLTDIGERANGANLEAAESLLCSDYIGVDIERIYALYANAAKQTDDGLPYHDRTERNDDASDMELFMAITDHVTEEVFTELHFVFDHQDDHYCIEDIQVID